MRCIAFAFSLIASSIALAAEEPSFTSVMRDGNVEIRDYAAMIVAEVEVVGSREQAPSIGFRPLGNYIFGANAPRQEIAMTAPVTTTQGQEIAMTAPVTSTSSDEGVWTVAFVMPSEWSMETLPEPDDPRVVLREVSPRRMVAIEFRGARSTPNLTRHLDALMEWLDDNGYQAVGAPEYAFYSAPWVPIPLRRNEIMVEINPR